MKVHEKIRFLREARELSQEDMAEKLKMSTNGYAKIERGESKPHIPKLEQIADVLEVDLIELMTLGERNISLNSNHGNGCNIIGSSKELTFEVQRLQESLLHKDEMIAQLKEQIVYLKQILEIHKTALIVKASRKLMK